MLLKRRWRFMNKVIMTGASGFVGSNLMPFLNDHKIDVVPINRNGTNVTWDTLDTISFSSKAIIHLAGKAHDVKNVSKVDEYTKINLGLTITAFETFKRTDAEIFIYFSSVKAVASKVEGVLNEEDLFEVDNPYGESKRKAEEYLLSQELGPNQRLFILRPCMIHGPGNKGNLNLLYQMAKRAIPFPFAAYENERSLLGIDNLNEIIWGFISKKPASGVYNLADDGYISTNQIYSLMGEALGKRLILLRFPKSLVKLIGRIGDKSPIPIDSLKIMKLTENYRVSNSKIKLALGWNKMPYSLEENLFKTISSFKK